MMKVKPGSAIALNSVGYAKAKAKEKEKERKEKAEEPKADLGSSHTKEKEKEKEKTIVTMAKEKEKEKETTKEKMTKDMEKVMHTRLMAVNHSRHPNQHKRQKLRRAQNQQVLGVTKIGHKIGGGVKDMPPQTANGAKMTAGPSTALAG